METSPLITEPGSFYHDKLAEYGKDHYDYKRCGACKGPYFGGLKSCALEMMKTEAKDKEAEELKKENN
jgi:hypothetical protein